MNRFTEWMMGMQASEHAAKIDNLYMFIFWLTLAFFILICYLTVLFAWKYKRKREGVLTINLRHNLALELVWSIVPLILVIGIFFWGFNDYAAASVAPNDALEIHVTGKKWSWTFEYPDGTRSIRSLHVPVNKPIRLILTSEDVLHAFFIPSLRTKTDVIPGRYVDLNFTATVAGKHQVFCAEYCGKDHSGMMADLYVDSPAKYAEWLEKGDEELYKMKPSDLGKMVWEMKGCNSCHTIDGAKGEGPSFKQLYGRTEKFKDGSTIVVDENYIRESILNPQAKIVAGYEPVMPTFQGLLREIEIKGVIAYIKELK
ncbi:MAG: cytochrome c oxidase subunit II [Bryobacteraceae bacterium]